MKKCEWCPQACPDSRRRFFCSNDAVAVAFRFAMKNGQICFSLRNSLRFRLRFKNQERKFSPKRKFLAGYPCGHPAKNFGQVLQMLEKQAFWNGHPARTSTKKLRSKKLRADFPFIQKIASDCGCDAVVHLGLRQLCLPLPKSVARIAGDRRRNRLQPSSSSSDGNGAGRPCSISTSCWWLRSSSTSADIACTPRILRRPSVCMSGKKKGIHHHCGNLTFFFRV